MYLITNRLSTVGEVLDPPQITSFFLLPRPRSIPEEAIDGAYVPGDDPLNRRPMTNRDIQKRHAKLCQSFRDHRNIALVFALNGGLFLLGYLILGGCSFLAETHEEGGQFLRSRFGDEFPVSDAVGIYSTVHFATVVFSLPSLAYYALMTCVQWVRLQRHRWRSRMVWRSAT